MCPTLEQIKTHSIVRALTPKHFLEGQQLPPRLNPFAHDIINMYGLVACKALPNIKVIPARHMMLTDFQNGRYAGVHTIVVDSSGNTAYAVARLAPAFGLEVKIILAADVPENKTGLLAALSTVDIIKVAKGKSVAERAREEGQRPGHYHLNQYGHESNAISHESITGPEIGRVLEENIGVIAIAMGSAGTAAGVGAYLKKYHRGAIVLGVCPKIGEQVPGARDRNRIAEVVTIPWKPFVDVVVEVSRKEAFCKTRELWGSIEPIVGPTSGLAYAGLLLFLDALTPEERKTLYGKRAAFLCPDAGYLYSDVIIAELDTGQGV